MTEYLIALYDDPTAPGHTPDELRRIVPAVDAVIEEMKAAGVFVFGGGLQDPSAAFAVDVSGGTPVFTDGPLAETKEYLGGFTIVDVPDDEAARLWAGRLALACEWPQEVRRFQDEADLEEMLATEPKGARS